MSVINFIHDTTFDDLPDAIIHEAVRCLIDTLGVAVAGSQTKLSKIIHNHAATQFGGDNASLWQDGRKVSAAGAALANGMTIDSVDAHDGHKLTKGHVGCGVIPGLIAVMEAERIVDAKELLTSVVIGYEIGTRAGISLHASASDYHTSGAWIALATAALGARQLKLSTSTTKEALGIAEYHGPRSQMMRCIDHPTMVKDGSGWGAMAGVSAAYLARDGFTGAPAITIDAPELAQYWNDLGSNWQITQQYIKLYPICRWAQPAVEAALSLVQEHGISADQIASIKIETFHEAKRLISIPKNTEQAQYSLPFSVAAALVRGTIGVKEITDSGLSDQTILAMAQRVKISETKDYNKAFPANRYARAHLQLLDGTVLTSDTTEAKGDPEDKVSDDVIFSKFKGLVNPVLGTERAEEMKGIIQGLSVQGDARNLFKLLAG